MKSDVINATTAEGVETVSQEGSIVPVYTFRKLQSTDMFLMFKIMGKIGINDISAKFGADRLQSLIGDGEKNVTAIGISIIFDVVDVLLTNLPKCENEIFEMLANVSDLSVDTIRQLDFAVFTEMIVEFIKKDEFKDFLKVVSRLFNRTK